MPIPMTICHIVDGQRILLGRKKVRFGVGLWNGFGGKVEPGEDVAAAAVREVREECGLRVSQPEHVGSIIVGDERYRAETWQLEVFRATEWNGELAASDEMEPRWFPLTAVPYAEMWPADRYWLPLLLAGKKFRGRFTFMSERELAPGHELREVPAL